MAPRHGLDAQPRPIIKKVGGAKSLFIAMTDGGGDPLETRDHLETLPLDQPLM
jgi:hypothetical protein